MKTQVLEAQELSHQDGEATRMASHEGTREGLAAPAIEMLNIPQMTQAEKDRHMMENVLGTESLIE
jgi:hypothetical protein